MKTVLTFLILFLIPNLSVALEHQELHYFHIPKQDRLHPIGYLSPEKRLRLVVELPIRNKAKRDRLLQDMYDPKSPEYHHYLTPREFAERFAPTKVNYDTVADFFKSRGFKVNKSPGRTILNIDGTVRLIESTFHTRIRLYKHPRKKADFYAPDKNPWIDLDIPLSGVVWLDNFRKPHPA
jgi:subtilase family serine protease